MSDSVGGDVNVHSRLTNLSHDSLEIGRPASFPLLVSFLLLGQMLQHFIISEDRSLSLEDLHGGGDGCAPLRL